MKANTDHHNGDLTLEHSWMEPNKLPGEFI